MSISRRDFLQIGSMAAAGLPLQQLSWAASDRPSDVPLKQFHYGAVRINAGQKQLQQLEQTHAVLMELSEDSLLKPFRVREGLPAPGADMGGWYDTWSFSPAETFGQWISALSRGYAIQPDQATYDKIDRLIAGYAATIDPAGKFYEENRFPAYIYDKLVCGLIDAHQFAGNPRALGVLERATSAVLSHLPSKAMPHQETPLVDHEDFTRHCWDESYTLPENQFLAWRLTGNARYLQLGKRFLFDEYFDPLARGENVLPGRHAYSHVNALSSAAEAYLALGADKYLRAAQNGLRFVQEQSFATGGWGPDEHFVDPASDKLADSLSSTHSSFETPCGAYAHFKLARYLLRITKDSRYGDSMEQVMYNTVLGAKPLQPDGHAFYYSDYNFAGTKTYHRDKWPCCSGTLPQVAADYGISSYFRDRDGVYVNLYIPSTLRRQQGSARVSVTQTGTYPEQGEVSLVVSTSRAVEFDLHLRVPEWAGDQTRIMVNGRRIAEPVRAGMFASVQRTWQNNDRVDLQIPLPMRLVAINRQHPDIVALKRGPLVLFATGNEPARFTRQSLLSAKSEMGAWQAQTANGRRSFVPFTAITDESYTTYVRLV